MSASNGIRGHRNALCPLPLPPELTRISVSVSVSVSHPHHTAVHYILCCWINHTHPPHPRPVRQTMVRPFCEFQNAFHEFWVIWANFGLIWVNTRKRRAFLAGLCYFGYFRSFFTPFCWHCCHFGAILSYFKPILVVLVTFLGLFWSFFLAFVAFWLG